MVHYAHFQWYIAHYFAMYHWKYVDVLLRNPRWCIAMYHCADQKNASVCTIAYIPNGTFTMVHYSSVTMYHCAISQCTIAIHQSYIVMYHRCKTCNSISQCTIAKSVIVGCSDSGKTKFTGALCRASLGLVTYP